MTKLIWTEEVDGFMEDVDVPRFEDIDDIPDFAMKQPQASVAAVVSNGYPNGNWEQPIWLEAYTAYELDEAGVLELLNTDEPLILSYDDRDVQAWVYTVAR